MVTGTVEISVAADVADKVPEDLTAATSGFLRPAYDPAATPAVATTARAFAPVALTTWMAATTATSVHTFSVLLLLRLLLLLLVSLHLLLMLESLL